MAKSVTTIPATLSRFTAAPINSTKKRRVAAYARVSTDNEEQLTSYEAQVDYYTNYIQGRDDWEFAGVYTDEGITGTNTKKREGFRSNPKKVLRVLRVSQECGGGFSLRQPKFSLLMRRTDVVFFPCRKKIAP